jgi:hypothetical protein
MSITPLYQFDEDRQQEIIRLHLSMPRGATWGSRLSSIDTMTASAPESAAFSLATIEIESAPSGNVRGHQCLKQTRMVWNPQVQQFVGHSEVLKAVALIRKIGR